MRRFVVALTAMLALAIPACGASYHTVYEGDVRFEHCYRLDGDTTVAPTSRLACWADWTKHHTDGQTRDRVEYALVREHALLAGDTRASGPGYLMSPGVSSAAILSAGGPAIACPIPTSPFENPPATLAASASPVASVASDPPGLTSSQLCVRDCGTRFTDCATKCTRPACVNKCGDLAKGCIGECL